MTEEEERLMRMAAAGRPPHEVAAIMRIYGAGVDGADELRKYATEIMELEAPAAAIAFCKAISYILDQINATKEARTDLVAALALTLGLDGAP